MNTDIKTLHFNMHEDTRKYLDKKLERLEHAKDHIVDLLLSFNKDKLFKAEATLNFRWGVQAHLVEEDFDLNVAIDKLFDKIIHKVSKEKERIQDHKA